MDEYEEIIPDNIIYEEETGIIKVPALKVDLDPQGIGHAFFTNMKRNGAKIAQLEVQTGRTESFAELLPRCIRCASELRNSGIEAGDVISICSRNTMDNTVPFYAAHLNGSIVASFDPTLSAEDTVHLLRQVRPRIIFADAFSEPLIENSLKTAAVDAEIVVIGDSNKYRTLAQHFNDESVDEDEFDPFVADDLQSVAVILFSSGTTGLSKGICITQEGLMTQAYLNISNGFTLDCNLSFASTYWISTVVISVTNALFGKCRCIFTEKFNPKELWYIIERAKLTFLFLAPSQAVMLLKSGRPDGIDTSSLRDVMVAGGPFSAENNLALRDLLPGSNVLLAYGQSEAAGFTNTFRMSIRRDVFASFHKPTSSGRPLAGFQYKVVDPETEEAVGLNERGELRYFSRTIMTGYYKRDASDAFDENGWIRSGDIVYFDDDFCIYIVDRIKEMLKFQGFHITPAKLEGILISHPQVASAAVIGIPDDDDGDHPMGLVILQDGTSITEEELERYVEARVDDRNRLRGGVKFLTAFPLTPSGKIRKGLLRDKILAGEL